MLFGHPGFGGHDLMRKFVWYLLMSLALAGLYGCGQKGAKLQKSVVPPDRTLFETGSEYLEKSQYLKARLAFQTLINTYPDSDLAADSYMAIGNSFYDEGGIENLLQAEDQYKNFIVFFPTSPKAADAQMKIISLNMKMMRAPDRDQQYSFSAQREIKLFLDQFPGSDYIPIAKQYLAEVEEVLAKGNYGIGQFYAERGNFAGARSRYQEIIENYPLFSALDDTYFLLADALEKSSNPDEAAIYYGRIAQGYPFSKRFDEAKQRIQALGKPLPPVDAQLAAVNQSRVKPPEGFSPLRPFIDFAEALGFKGPPDRYELARKTIEAEKTKSAEAQQAEAAGAQGSDGILIQTTLKKDASGNTQQTTVVGGEAAPAQQNAGAKSGDKETAPGTDKKVN
jgi:outer membrane assembly lipoprotein YfiO